MDVLTYLEALESIQEKHPILVEMEELGRRRGFPILHPLSARFLSVIAAVSRSRYVLEIGSGFGYSALWIALHNPFLEKIILTDLNADNLELARQFFERAGILDKAEFIVEDGVEVLNQLDFAPDLIFNDAHKIQYPTILELARQKLEVGGALISDNAFWLGRVLDASNRDPSVEAIREFTRLSFSYKDLLTTLVPVGDGLIVSVKVMEGE